MGGQDHHPEKSMKDSERPSDADLDKILKNAEKHIAEAEHWKRMTEGAGFDLGNLYLQRADYYISRAIYEQNKAIIELLKQIR